MSSQSGTPQADNLPTKSLQTLNLGEEYYNDDGGTVGPETIRPNPGPAHPTHYLSRGEGKFTPLIALDELPAHIKLTGLPFTMSLMDIVSAGGTPIMPAIEKAKEPYVVNVDHLAATGHSTHSTGGDASGTVNVPSSGTINARLARAIDGVGSTTDPEQLKQAILQLKASKIGAGSTQRYNPTTPGVLGQKVYCTHWMRTGECDFTQQGCMFLHAMPDLDTLELLGFRAYPRWFREMPRDYQVQNAKDFNEIGLDQHRHAHGQYQAMAGGHWNNPGNRYMPPRGIQNGYPYVPPSPQMMPVQRGQWSNAGYNQGPPGITQGTNGQYNGADFTRPMTPENFGPLPHQPGYYGMNDPHSIWSRTTSPAMDVMNRLHKPLSPEISSSYPLSPQTISGPPTETSSISPPLSDSGVSVRNNVGDLKRQPNGNPKTSIVIPLNARGRGKQTRRQTSGKGPQTPKVATKNPYDALSVEGSPDAGKSE